jgi:hypothetical protein
MRLGVMARRDLAIRVLSGAHLKRECPRGAPTGMTKLEILFC